jgi:hypothetical protein
MHTRPRVRGFYGVHKWEIKRQIAFSGGSARDSERVTGTGDAFKL